MKRFFTISILLFLLVISFSCKKNTPEATGVLKDYTGFDGCRFLVFLDNGEKLEPVSLPANVTLVNNARVAVCYKIVYRASICMMGETAEIISLRYL